MAAAHLFCERFSVCVCVCTLVPHCIFSRTFGKLALDFKPRLHCLSSHVNQLNEMRVLAKREREIINSSLLFSIRRLKEV